MLFLRMRKNNILINFTFSSYNVSSESGPYSAIDPYVKPFFPPEFSQPWLITALTPVLIDNEEIQTE